MYAGVLMFPRQSTSFLRAYESSVYTAPMADPFFSSSTTQPNERGNYALTACMVLPNAKHRKLGSEGQA